MSNETPEPTCVDRFPDDPVMQGQCLIYELLGEIYGELIGEPDFGINSIRGLLAGTEFNLGQAINNVYQLLFNKVEGDRIDIQNGISGAIGQINQSTAAQIGALNQNLATGQSILSQQAYNNHNQLVGLINDVLNRSGGISESDVAFVKQGLINLWNRFTDFGLDQTNDLIQDLLFENDLIVNTVNGLTSNLNSQTQTLQTNINSAISNINTNLKNDLTTVQNNLVGWVEEQSRETNRNIDGAVGTIVADSTEQTDILSGLIASGLETTLEGLETFDESIGEPLRNLLDDVDDIPQDIAEGVGNFITNAFETGFGSITNQWANMSVFLQKLANNEYQNWDEFQEDFNSIFVGSDILYWVMNIVAIPFLAGDFIKLMTYPAQVTLTQLANSRARPGLPTQEMVQRWFFKTLISEDDARDYLARAGFPDDFNDVLLEKDIPLVPTDVLRELLMRNKISSADFYRIMNQYGWNATQIDMIVDSFEVIPPPSDLIRMLVREVFSPDKRAAFGLDEDYPEEFTGYMAQHGYPEQWSKNYWAAHWQLPSMTQIWEMLHRGLINEQELDNFLAANDVMPVWRDRLKAISYKPFTRVDTRRMFETGVLTYDEVVQSYKDQGYDDEKANRLAEFTRRLSIDKDGSEFKKLTQSAIVRAVKSGIRTEEEGLNELIELGYEPLDADLILRLGLLDASADLTLKRIERENNQLINHIIDFYTKRSIDDGVAKQNLADAGIPEGEATRLLEIADLDYSQMLKNEIIDRVKEMYVRNQITEQDMRVVLASYQFSLQEVDKIINDINLLKSLRSGQLSKSELKKAFFSDQITLDQYVEQLQGMGLSDLSIDILVRTEISPTPSN